MKKAILLLFFTLMALPVNAATVTDLYYNITFLGFDTGDIHYRIVTDGDKYTLTFDGGIGGFAGIFADADGRATTNGIIKDGKIIPVRMDQISHWGDKERNVFVKFDANSNVVDYGAHPRFDPSNRVPITPDMLLNVRDTQSALIMPASDAVNLCNQTVRVFDGRERYDLTYSPMGKTPLQCRVTPTRVGGHKLNDGPQPPFKITLRIIDVGNGQKLAVPAKTVKPFTMGSAIITLTKVNTYQQ